MGGVERRDEEVLFFFTFLFLRSLRGNASPGSYALVINPSYSIAPPSAIEKEGEREDRVEELTQRERGHARRPCTC
jgi:hypothetical protein